MKANFTLSLKAAFDKIGERAEAAKTIAVIEASNRIRVRTPVDTGRLRANWQLGEDIITGPVKGPVSDVVPPAFRAMYLVNNLPYARRIEFGFTGEDSLGRSYNQTGAGMVGLTVLEWPEIVKAAVAAVK